MAGRCLDTDVCLLTGRWILVYCPQEHELSSAPAPCPDMRPYWQIALLMRRSSSDEAGSLGQFSNNQDDFWQTERVRTMKVIVADCQSGMLGGGKRGAGECDCGVWSVHRNLSPSSAASMTGSSNGRLPNTLIFCWLYIRRRIGEIGVGKSEQKCRNTRCASRFRRLAAASASRARLERNLLSL